MFLKLFKYFMSTWEYFSPKESIVSLYSNSLNYTTLYSIRFVFLNSWCFSLLYLSIIGIQVNFVIWPWIVIGLKLTKRNLNTLFSYKNPLSPWSSSGNHAIKFLASFCSLALNWLEKIKNPAFCTHPFAWKKVLETIPLNSWLPFLIVFQHLFRSSCLLSF